jgi:hypothetical protein
MEKILGKEGGRMHCSLSQFGARLPPSGRPPEAIAADNSTISKMNG